MASIKVKLNQEDDSEIKQGFDLLKKESRCTAYIQVLPFVQFIFGATEQYTSGEEKMVGFF